MITRNRIIATLAPALAAALAAATTPPVNASATDHVSSNAASTHCLHGLWAGAAGRGCLKRYSFHDGSTVLQDIVAGPATFPGAAANNPGKSSAFNLQLKAYQDALTPGQTYKARSAYNMAAMGFYSQASGTITTGGKVYALHPHGPTPRPTPRPAPRPVTVQTGAGANDRTGDFGGSARFTILGPSGWSLPHWDNSFILPPRAATKVSAPGGMALLGLSLVVLWAVRRRNTGY
ncbi:hypothetical protein [Pontixanthobacter sp.]|uniref:hypothetical protein n=1 Tax=Pontixanthobacter sp. TaxID=2792078 RepID=UPI003C7E3030